MKKSRHIEYIKDSLHILTSSRKKALGIVMLDIIFLLAYGFVRGSPETFGFLSVIYEYLKSFLTLASQQAKELALEAAKQTSIFTIMRDNPVIAHYFWLLVLSLILFALSTYFIYCFIEGAGWHLSFGLANAHAGNKTGFKNFIRQFFVVNIPWFLLFMLYVIVSFIDSFRATTLERLGHQNPLGLKIASIIYLLLIAYFAVISYSLIGTSSSLGILKRALSLGAKKYAEIVPAFALVVLAFVVLNYALIAIGKLSSLLMIIIGIAAVFPVIVLARVYLKRVIGNIA